MRAATDVASANVANLAGVFTLCALLIVIRRRQHKDGLDGRNALLPTHSNATSERVRGRFPSFMRRGDAIAMTGICPFVVFV
jgi:hypothetical protein